MEKLFNEGTKQEEKIAKELLEIYDSFRIEGFKMTNLHFNNKEKSIKFRIGIYRLNFCKQYNQAFVSDKKDLFVKYKYCERSSLIRYFLIEGLGN